jgi:hypothetical protein
MFDMRPRSQPMAEKTTLKEIGDMLSHVVENTATPVVIPMGVWKRQSSRPCASPAPLTRRCGSTQP